MYTNLGYIVYRTVLEYYSGDPDEDAYGTLFFSVSYILIVIFYIYTDMRKACSRDVKQKSIIPLSHPVRPEDVD